MVATAIAGSTVPSALKGALDELGSVADRIDAAAVDAACARIAESGKIALYGCGREGLQMRGFAMRLFHLGLDVAMVGDINAPALGQGDLLICSNGPGGLKTVAALMETARAAGASILLLTAQASVAEASGADNVVIVPAQTMADDQGASATSVLPMGSLYEGALFVLFEVMVLTLRERLGVTAEAMRARHTNLE